MAKAIRSISRAVATRKAPIPIIPISARGRAVLRGENASTAKHRREQDARVAAFVVSVDLSAPVETLGELGELTVAACFNLKARSRLAVVMVQHSTAAKLAPWAKP